MLRSDDPHKLESLHPIRMSPFDYNNPHIFAYSACFQGGIAMVHAHVRGEGTDFYQTISSDFTLWQYMPIGDNEMISHIWKHQGYEIRDLALVVSLRLCNNRTSC